MLIPKTGEKKLFDHLENMKILILQELIFFNSLCTCNFISLLQNSSYKNNTVHLQNWRDSDLSDIFILTCGFLNLLKLPLRSLQNWC